MYVPLFVDKWLDDPIRGPNNVSINFAGFAVGDGFPSCVAVDGKPVVGGGSEQCGILSISQCVEWTVLGCGVFSRTQSNERIVVS